MLLRINTYLILILFFVSSCQSRKNGPEYILKFGHQANEQDVWHRSAMHFAKVVDSISGGRIEVRIFPSEQLGAEMDMIRLIRAGVVEMTITAESMQNWAEVTAFCAIPYLIRDSRHLKQVVDGYAGKKIASEMINKIGLRPIAYFERGPRHLTTNRPVMVPGDLKGIVLRVPNVPIFIQVWKSLGAKPTPMAFSEVFTALQQGTVEAQENPFSLIYSAGFFEVQKYINLTSHVRGWTNVVIGEKLFISMPEELQNAILEAGKSMQEYHEKEFEKQEQVLRQRLEEKGMVFIEPDVDAFREKAGEIVLQALPESLRPFYFEIVNMNTNNPPNEITP